MSEPVLALLPPLLQHEQPDAGHEALRLAFMQALSDLLDTSVSMGDFRVALQILSALATSYANAVTASATDRQDLHNTDAAIMSTLAALAQRVVDLENRPVKQLRLTGARKNLATVAITTGTDYPLTWDTPFADTDYTVVPMHSGGVINATVVEKAGSRTTTGITYRVTNTALISVGGTIAAVAAAYT